jgi:predicted esterase
MSFIKHRSTRLMLAIAAVLALASMTLPASAATAAPAAPAACDTTPVFFGLHGMGEGPDSAKLFKPHRSTEMLDFDHQQNQVSGKVLFAPITYPRVDPDKWRSLLSTPSAVKAGVTALNTAITDYTAGCKASQDHIALVGYSMGAWVINLWLIGHPKKWNLIKAVVLFGDPCYKSGISKGLVRRSAVWGTCMPARSYPLPASTGVPATLKAKSYTEPQDPVSGRGWGLDPRAAQLLAAVRCLANNCSHLHYATDPQAGASSAPLIAAGVRFVVGRVT